MRHRLLKDRRHFPNEAKNSRRFLFGKARLPSRQLQIVGITNTLQDWIHLQCSVGYCCYYYALFIFSFLSATASFHIRSTFVKMVFTTGSGDEDSLCGELTQEQKVKRKKNEIAHTCYEQVTVEKYVYTQSQAPRAKIFLPIFSTSYAQHIYC